MITPERLPRVRPRRSSKQRWTRRVRALIVANLGRFPILPGIVAAILLPGGFVIVPLVAWWHRRKRAVKQALRASRS